MSSIRITDPFPRAPKYGDAEIAAVTELLRTGRLSDLGRGPATAALEDDFADLAGTAYALSFNSGTAALQAALHGTIATADTDRDAGIAMSPLTWISAITSAFHAGSFPRFVDLAPDSPNLDPGAVPDDRAAVLVTHTYGIPAPMDAVLATGIPTVEDCSHAHGAVYQGQPVGSWGAAGAFSLQESKAVSAGEGGILTTNDRAVYEHALTLGHHPARLAAELTHPHLAAYTDAGASHKFRMPTVAAAVARVQLAGLHTRMRVAEDNLAHLTGLLAAADTPLVPTPIPAQSVRGWYGTCFTVLRPVPSPGALVARCTDAGIPVRALYLDWLTTGLLQDPERIRHFWPHTGGRWQPPSAGELPRYEQFCAQTLVLKVPEVPAAAYLDQVAAALDAVLRDL
ncbi:DegT/DnrJ/EryC1/StrS family aminotransferase [Yinghuangia aomiensis]